MDVQSAQLLAKGITELVLCWCDIFLSPMLVYVWFFVSLLWCAGSSAPAVCFLLLWLGQFCVSVGLVPHIYTAFVMLLLQYYALFVQLAYIYFEEAKLAHPN